jgi:hypothetical protein
MARLIANASKQLGRASYKAPPPDAMLRRTSSTERAMVRRAARERPRRLDEGQGCGVAGVLFN